MALASAIQLNTGTIYQIQASAVGFRPLIIVLVLDLMIQSQQQVSTMTRVGQIGHLAEAQASQLQPNNTHSSQILFSRQSPSLALTHSSADF